MAQRSRPSKITENKAVRGLPPGAGARRSSNCFTAVTLAPEAVEGMFALNTPLAHGADRCGHAAADPSRRHSPKGAAREIIEEEAVHAGQAVARLPHRRGKPDRRRCGRPHWTVSNAVWRVDQLQAVFATCARSSRCATMRARSLSRPRGSMLVNSGIENEKFSGRAG